MSESVGFREINLGDRRGVAAARVARRRALRIISGVGLVVVGRELSEGESCSFLKPGS